MYNSNSNNNFSVEYFETKIKNECNDYELLKIYKNYLSWAKKFCRKNYNSILKKICFAFINNKELKNNEKYILVWIKYASIDKENAHQIYKTIEENEIGLRNHLFYEAYSTFLVSRKDYQKALKILEKGIEKDPNDYLLSSRKKVLKKLKIIEKIKNKNRHLFNEKINKINNFDEKVNKNNNFDEKVDKNRSFDEKINENNNYNENLNKNSNFYENLDKNINFNEKINKNNKMPKTDKDEILYKKEKIAKNSPNSEIYEFFKKRPKFETKIDDIPDLKYNPPKLKRTYNSKNDEKIKNFLKSKPKQDFKLDLKENNKNDHFDEFFDNFITKNNLINKRNTQKSKFDDKIDQKSYFNDKTDQKNKFNSKKIKNDDLGYQKEKYCSKKDDNDYNIKYGQNYDLEGKFNKNNEFVFVEEKNKKDDFFNENSSIFDEKSSIFNEKYIKKDDLFDENCQSDDFKEENDDFIPENNQNIFSAQDTYIDPSNFTFGLNRYDSLSAATKTFNFNINEQHSIARTPVPKRLFVSKVGSFKKKKGEEPKFEEEIFFIDPFCEKLRSNFVQRKVRDFDINLKTSKFCILSVNRLTEFNLFSAENINLSGKFYTIKKIEKIGKGFDFKLIVNRKKDIMMPDKYSIRLSENKDLLKYEYYIGRNVQSSLSSNDLIHFILPYGFTEYSDKICKFKAKIPTEQIFIEKLISGKYIEETFVAFIGHQIVKAISALHSSNIIHGDISLKYLYFVKLDRIFNEKTVFNENSPWENIYKSAGVALELSPLTFSLKIASSDSFRKKTENKSFDLETIFDSQPMKLRNNKIWNFHIDGIGIASILFKLLTNSELVLNFKNNYYSIKNDFDSEIDKEMWYKIFNILLNLKNQQNGNQPGLDYVEKILKDFMHRKRLTISALSKMIQNLVQ